MRAPKFARILHSLQRLRWRLSGPLTVGVRLLAVDRGQIILVRHTYLDGWYLPGGGVKAREALGDAMRREAAEEVGAELHELRLFGVYSSFQEGKSDHIVVFVCEDFTYRNENNREIESVGFFALSELPEGTSPGTRRRIAEFAAGERAVSSSW